MTQACKAEEAEVAVAVLPASLWPEGLSPEFRLLLCCLRWPVSPLDVAKIRAHAEAVHDWNRVLAVAGRHRVIALVWKALSIAKVAPPPIAAAAFQQAAFAATRRAFLLATETSRLSDLFRHASIDALFMKGTAVAMLAYGDLSVRHAKDIDILVPDQAALESTFALLQRNGYRPAFDLDSVTAERRQLWFRHAKSMDWTHGAHGTQLELHWRLTDLPLLRGEAPAYPVQSVTVSAKANLQTLAPDALLAYLCVHGAAHGWMRLKWLADINALLPQDGKGCEAVYQRLLALGAGRAAGEALLLCHDLLGLELPPQLLRRLEADAILRLLRAMALRLFRPDAEATEVHDLRFGTTSVYCARLLVGSSPRTLRKELRTWAYRPEDLLTTRLPEPLWFAYPVVRAGAWIVARVKHGGRSAPAA